MEKKIIGICPLCNGNVVKTARGYRCENNTGDNSRCVFFINSMLANRHMTDDEIRELLEKKELLGDGFSTKEGKVFTTIIRLDASGNTSINSAVGKCPRCNGELRVNSRAFSCSNYNHPQSPCAFTIWRSIGGHDVTLCEVREICNSGSTEENVEMYMDDGTPFQKKLSLSEYKLKIVKI